VSVVEEKLDEEPGEVLRRTIPNWSPHEPLHVVAPSALGRSWPCIGHTAGASRRSGPVAPEARTTCTPSPSACSDSSPCQNLHPHRAGPQKRSQPLRPQMSGRRCASPRARCPPTRRRARRARGPPPRGPARRARRAAAERQTRRSPRGRARVRVYDAERALGLELACARRDEELLVVRVRVAALRAPVAAQEAPVGEGDPVLARDLGGGEEGAADRADGLIGDRGRRPELHASATTNSHLRERLRRRGHARESTTRCCYGVAIWPSKGPPHPLAGKQKAPFPGPSCGGAYRDRTGDLRLAKPTLSQLS
jgi:hypothetical protein